MYFDIITEMSLLVKMFYFFEQRFPNICKLRSVLRNCCNLSFFTFHKLILKKMI